MNDRSVKVEFEGVCVGCLSQDRHLRPLGALRELFNRIILQEDKVLVYSHHSISQTELLLCWECISYLRNMQKFQQRVHSAQTLLQLTSKCILVKHPVLGISTLVHTYKDTFDYNLTYDKNEVKVFNNMVKTEDDKQDIVNLNIVKDDESSDYNNDNYDNDNNEFDNDECNNDKKITKVMKIKSKREKKNNIRNSYSVVNFKDCIKSKTIYAEISNDGRVGYKCNLCVHVSASLKELYGHMKVKHERAVTCLVCNTICNNMHDYFAHHRKYHREFICDYCGARKKQKHTLERHIIAKHTLPRCKLCNITFKRHSLLRHHHRGQHTVRPSEATYCVECDIMFDNIELFKRHFSRVVHKKPKDQRVHCQYCNKVFAKKWNLQKHITRIHEQPDTYEFQCDLCDKSYVTAFRLRCHRSRVHLKIAPARNFACDLCGRKFSQRRILENHVRTHTGERPFLCNLCSASFAQKSALVSHAARRHHLKLGYSDKIPES